MVIVSAVISRLSCLCFLAYIVCFCVSISLGASLLSVLFFRGCFYLVFEIAKVGFKIILRISSAVASFVSTLVKALKYTVTFWRPLLLSILTFPLLLDCSVHIYKTQLVVF